jgi:hypothetical protein
MVKLSPSRFYVEISFSNFAIFALEYGQNHRFLAIIRRKNYLLLGKIIKFGQIFRPQFFHPKLRKKKYFNFFEKSSKESH